MRWEDDMKFCYIYFFGQQILGFVPRHANEDGGLDNNISYYKKARWTGILYIF